jgi:hypothetical protein
MDDALSGYCALCGSQVLYIVFREKTWIRDGIVNDGCEVVDAEPEVFKGKLGYVQRVNSNLFKASLHPRMTRYRPHRCVNRKGVKTGSRKIMR